MRHFLTLALTPPQLTRGMMAAPTKRFLVARPRPLQTLSARHASTFSGTVTLTVIAPPADAQLPLAARAVQQSVADDPDHDFSRCQHTGQRAVIASLSLQRDRRRAAITRRSLR